MIFVFDPKSLTLQVKVGTMEEYKPSEEVKELQSRVTALLKKTVEFRQQELEPEIKAIMEKVEELNKPYMPKE